MSADTAALPASGRDMHVVHYIDHLRDEGSGVVRSVLDIARVVSDHGCRITLLTLDPGDSVAKCAALGIAVEQIDLPRNPLASCPAATAEKVAQLLSDANVLHLHTLWDPCNLAMAKLATRAGVPYVMSMHGMLDDWAIGHKGLKKKIHLALVGRRLLRGAARLHCSANQECRQVESRVSGVNTFVAPLAFDVLEYEHLPGPKVAQAQFDCLSHTGPKSVVPQPVASRQRCRRAN